MCWIIYSFLTILVIKLIDISEKNINKEHHNWIWCLIFIIFSFAVIGITLFVNVIEISLLIDNLIDFMKKWYKIYIQVIVTCTLINFIYSTRRVELFVDISKY